MRALTLVFFLASGAAGLVYEVAWIRQAGTVVGNTTYAIGTVIGAATGAAAGTAAAAATANYEGCVANGARITATLDSPASFPVASN